MSDSQQRSDDVEQQQSESREQRRESRASRRMSRVETVANDPNLDEYERIVKYVSVYREPGKAAMEEEQEVEEKRVWYAPWRKRRVRKRRAEGAPQFPDDWLLTDIKQGLSNEEVLNRRRRSGWNELVSEKENPIAKFLSYFQGPILYGESIFSLRSYHLLPANCHLSHGAGRDPCRRSKRLGRLRCYHRHSVPQRVRRLVSRKASSGCCC
jgi:H+-transporting ATPase